MILARQEFDIVLDEIPFMDELLGRRDLYRLSIPETPDGSETPIAARRADALERIADSYLSNTEQAVNGGDRCTLHIHTDSNTLQEDGEGAEAQLETGGCVSAETSHRLACDCGVVRSQVLYPAELQAREGRYYKDAFFLSQALIRF